MSQDQSNAAANMLIADKWPLWLLLTCGAVGALLACLFVQLPQIKFALFVCAVTLALSAVLLALKTARTSAEETRLKTAAIRLLKYENQSAFLVGADGAVQYANPAALERFNARTGTQLADVFEQILAYPQGVVGRLFDAAQSDNAGSEDIVTRAGKYCLHVNRIGPDQFIWRLDDFSGKGDLGHNNQVIPMMTVGPDGDITEINTALSTILGSRPAKLSDVFCDLPVESGQLHRVRTEAGTLPLMVVETRAEDDQCHFFVLPDAKPPAMPRTLGAGWDAIEDLPVPLMKIAADGQILASNREARVLLNVKDTSGTRAGDLLDGLGRPISDWLREVIEGRDGHISQFLRGRGDNQETFVQVTLNLTGDTTDPHLIAVLNDVTELKTLEGQFVQSQKMQAIGQLAGGVAHDFNNLLTAISGHCDLLLLRHDEGDQNYGDLIQIHQNANRAASLVGQLLAFSRKQNLQPEVIDLRDTLSDLTHLLNRLVGEKVSLTLHHDPALAQIKADKRQLEQVLMNLVVNARDAMPNGGNINVVTENMILDKQITKDRAVIPPGEYVVVNVIDEGHGIPPEKLPKIFDPFYTTKRLGEGTGLGLSTAYGIVKQTGGYIFAESDVEKGTKFSLLFPSHDLPVAEPVSLQSSGPELLSSEGEGVVLLVEDEAPVRAFASRALRLSGYTVLEADCAEAALDLLVDDELNVDVFVTDVIMPGKDGPTWVREALERRPDTRVVFVSGYAEDAFGDEQSRIPHSVFLPKPFSLNALTQTVQTQLQRSREAA